MVSIASGLTTQTWKLLHDTISGLISDPSTRSKKWIFSSFPDATKNSFPGYPIMTIDSPNTTGNKATFKKMVYSADSSINLYDTSIARSDALMGSVVRVLDNRNNCIHASGLTNTVITNSSTEAVEINGKKIHIKMLGLDFDVVNS